MTACATSASARRCTRSTRGWQAIAREYEPKPMFMGETYVELPKLWAYAQQLDLVQNFTFLKAELDRRRAATDRRARSRQSCRPGATPVWFGSNHDHSRLATRWAGGDERKARAALFLLLTLRGSTDPLPGRRARSASTARFLPPAPPTSPTRRATPSGRRCPGRRLVASGASLGCRSPTRSGMSRTSVPIRRARSTTCGRSSSSGARSPTRRTFRCRALPASGPMPGATSGACST